MTKYTVLLLRPDYVSTDPYDTYLAHVEATSVKVAVAKAQVEAAILDAGDVSDAEKLDAMENCLDYFPMFTCEGHHNDLTGDMYE